MTLPAVDDRNADQIAYWNGAGGRHWTDRQQLQDIVLAPVSEVLIDRAKVKTGEAVIDVGCGCGSTSFDLAKRVGPGGHVSGIDISEPMLSRARELTPLGEPVEFVLADATVYPFAPANTDLLFSRFGVMFFAQPSVSFANMRKALRPDGRLAFACWRTPRDNPWMMLGLQEAYKHVPKLPEVKPEDPGPFAFASEERVHRILGEAGFMNIAMERVDLLLDIATGRGLEAAIESILAIGPTSRALDGQPPDKIAAATESIRSMLRSHLNGNSVSLGGSIWIVTAVNGR
ncbi:class I SAM-dependent methyltransferase [Bradyrhizobium sp. G127]|jgi:SAM-dependent methyltransferase|uniref:class I SAM-dependent methyltransferase n=1 Tax=Bradyrhizobium sp. G127 TaxID=2904800 RepID=UPI001F171E72|nr:class I SAM-dependent methyltransferase [Bradyrhizobium sp. G127]MCF2523179.1 methyltransferase domain-containing protein [Bradyrhizobium sp. G127]